MKPKKKNAPSRRRSGKKSVSSFWGHGPVLIWTMNRDGLVESVAGKGLPRLGLRPKDWTGRSLFDIYRDVSSIVTVLRRALGGEFFSERLTIGEAALEVKWVPRMDVHGRCVGCVGIATEAVEPEAKNESMDRREERYRSWIENSHDALYILDGQGRWIYESPSVERVLGYKPGERLSGDVYGFIHPGDQADFRVVFEKLAKIPSVTYRTQFRSRHKTGGWRHLESAVTNLAADPVVGGWVVHFWDISELKRASEIVEKQEQYYRALIENTHELVALLDREAVVRYATPSIQKILGCSPAEQVGKNFLEWVHPEDLARTKEVFDRNSLAMGRTLAVDFRVRHRDGSWRFLEASVTNLFKHPAVAGMILNARDVTERKNADEALRDRERYFRALTENASDVVYVMDRDGRRFYESASTEKVLGYAPGERDARDTFHYLHPEDLEAGKAAFREALERPGEPVPTELRTRHKDGRWIHMEVVATNLLDVAAVRGVVVNCRDITGRRKAEEDSRRSEERFRSLIEHSNDVISLVDAKGNNLYISPSIRKVMGYDPAERLGRNFFEMVHPEDLEWVRKDFGEFIQEKDSVRRARLRVKHSDGTWRWVEVTATHLSDQPTVGGIIFNYRDITEGKKAEMDLMKSEENFRNLIEKSPDAMMVHTERMVYYVNGAWLRLLGYEAPEELIGGSPLALVHPDDLERIKIRIRQLSTSAGGYNPPRETRLLRKDGRVLDVETISFSILYGGEPMAVVVARDMTGRKAAEQALLKYERLRALGEMAAGMAHEIRNPLFGIRLSAEYLLKKIDPPPEGRTQIQNILDQSDRLGRLVDDTLDYSKEKQALETRSVDALDLLRTSLRLAQVQYGPNHHRFQVRWESRDDLYLIQTNAYRIQQILVNLILNAFQAMGTEGTLTLSCGKRANRFEFVVRDDGPGISDKKVTRLFEPFFTTKSSGSGLGLSVSQKIAESHGGKIRMERRQPRGTDFILELPAEKDAT